MLLYSCAFSAHVSNCILFQIPFKWGSMKKKILALAIILCSILNVLVCLIIKSEGKNVNSLMTSAKTTDINLHMNTFDENSDNKNDSENSSTDNNDAQDKDSEYARVLISTSDYNSLYHNEIELSSESGFRISYGNVKDKIIEDAAITIKSDSEYFDLDGDNDENIGADTIIIRPIDDNCIEIDSISRSCGTPEYSGYFQVQNTADGMLLINCVPVEDYICGVVASEMNGSFPSEALKTQAVCTRTYLYYIRELGKYSEYNADIEDSKACQVYNNNSVTDTVKETVADTAGYIITYNNSIINAVYFSTSCGVTTDGNVFNKTDMDYTSSVFVSGNPDNAASSFDMTNETDFANFIDGYYEAYDSEYPYYRWSVYVSLDEMRDSILKATSVDVGKVTKITVGSRIAGGALTKITVYGSESTVMISGQDNIRAALCSEGETVALNDGTESRINTLPSAFFYFEEQYGDGKLSAYKLVGGGFGHGCGLSQNAAKTMAESGLNWRDIIAFFYKNVEIEQYSLH